MPGTEAWCCPKTKDVLAATVYVSAKGEIWVSDDLIKGMMIGVLDDPGGAWVIGSSATSIAVLWAVLHRQVGQFRV